MEASDVIYPVLERTRLVDDVIARLRTMIIDGALPPGTTLLQIDLAQKLGVSRTPLREAFRILEHEGLVRVTNGNKTLEVVEPSREDMVELYQFREVIDGLAARLAAKIGISESDYLVLKGHLDRMHAIDENAVPDGSARAAAHAAFHAGVAELSGNRMVMNQVPMIRMTSQMLARRITGLGTVEPDVTAMLLREGESDHRAVLEAIRSNSGTEAEAIARRHIRRTIRSELVSR
jgi:GntR family transcriptional regulator, vanillate catabolism transcriptional regulator